MEQQVWREYRKSRRRSDRNKIIAQYLPFAKMMAVSLYRHWTGSEIMLEDFVQYGTVGLIEAVDGFDPGKGFSFETFARFRIRGAILNSIAGYSENLSYANYRKQIDKERWDSITKHTSTKQKSTFDRLVNLTATAAVSHLLGDDATDAFDGLHDDSPYAQPIEITLRAQIFALIDHLCDRTRPVLKLHYVEGMTFTEIAMYLGLSKATVSLRHANGLVELRGLYHANAKLDKMV